MEDLGHVDLDGQSGLGNPGLTDLRRNADGDELSGKFTVPALAVFPVARTGRPDCAQASLQLAGDVVGRPGAADRDLTVLS